MTPVKVSKINPTDHHQQVAGEIRRAIADGEAKPGERLPPAKDLAGVLGVKRPPCCMLSNCCATRVCSSSAAAAGFSVAGTAAHGAVAETAPEFVLFAPDRGARPANGSRSINDVAGRPAAPISPAAGVMFVQVAPAPAHSASANRPAIASAPRSGDGQIHV